MSASRRAADAVPRFSLGPHAARGFRRPLRPPGYLTTGNERFTVPLPVSLDFEAIVTWHCAKLYLTVLCPAEVPSDWLDKFRFVDNPERQKISAMVAYMDDVVGRLVHAFKEHGLRANTLAVFIADNGGAIYYPAGGNNYPLRGGM